MEDKVIDDFGTDEYCTCDKYDYEDHICPFSEAMNDDNDSLCTCNCCPHCHCNCSMDI